MLLRMLVSNFIRQTAERKIHDVVRNRASRGQGESGPETVHDHEAQPLTEEIPPCDAAFVFAMGIESGGFVDLLPDVVATRCESFLEHAAYLDQRRVVVVDSGVGCEAAAKATEDLIAIHKPAWVISAGFAGGLQDELRRGHILMADHLVDCDGNELEVGLKLDPQVIAATKGLHVGRLVTVDHIIRDEKEKRALGQQHDAMACDMETMAVAQTCQRHKVRFLSVRIISDAVDDHLPAEIEKLISQKTLAGKLGAAAGAIFGRVSSVKDMWKLKEDALKASDRLAKFLVGVIPQLTGDENDSTRSTAE